MVSLNIRCCGPSTGEQRMLNFSNILEDPPLGGSTSLTVNVPEVLFIAEPLMDIRNTLPGDTFVKLITLLLKSVHKLFYPRGMLIVFLHFHCYKKLDKHHMLVVGQIFLLLHHDHQ